MYRPILGVIPQSPCHFKWPSARFSQTVRSSYLSHVIAATTYQRPSVYLGTASGCYYSSTDSLKSPASGIATVSESRLMSQVGRVREVLFALISVLMHAIGAMEVPVFLLTISWHSSQNTNWMPPGHYRDVVWAVLSTQCSSGKLHTAPAHSSPTEVLKASGNFTHLLHKWCGMQQVPFPIRFQYPAIRWKGMVNFTLRLIYPGKKFAVLAYSLQTRNSRSAVLTRLRSGPWRIGVRSPEGAADLSPPKSAHQLWRPPNLLFSEHLCLIRRR